MSLKNIFTEDEYYEPVTSAQWTSIVNSTPPPPPPPTPATPYAVVTSMYPQVFAPETAGVWGFVSSNLFASDTTITSPNNNEIQIENTGIYRVDFYLAYSAGVSITCTSSVDQVSGTVIQLAAASAVITANAYSWVLQTFIVNIAVTNSVFQLANNVSAGTTGVDFLGANSSILITQLE